MVVFGLYMQQTCWRWNSSVILMLVSLRRLSYYVAEITEINIDYRLTIGADKKHMYISV